MAVFNGTQTAFRASITQTDVLEGSRAAMDLMVNDFRQMYPSGGNNATNYDSSIPWQFKTYLPPSIVNPYNPPSAPINFWVSTNSPTVVQSLIGSTLGGSSAPNSRTNQVQSVFILTFQDQVWRGIGYFVDTNSAAYIYPLYRYDSYLSTNLPARPTPVQIFTNFSWILGTMTNFDANPYGYVSRLLDGVVQYNVLAFDTNGVWLTNGYTFGQPITVENSLFYPPTTDPSGAISFFMCSNTLPSAVEIQMGVLEDRTLQRASTFLPNSLSQSNYLAQQAGKVHLFRQRVTIPNLDPVAYQ
jgi:hypothetical protein